MQPKINTYFFKVHFNIRLAQFNFHFWYQHSRIWGVILGNALLCAFADAILLPEVSSPYLACIVNTYIPTFPGSTQMVPHNCLLRQCCHSLIVFRSNLFIPPSAFLLFKLQLFGYLLASSTKVRSGTGIWCFVLFLSPESCRAPGKQCKPKMCPLNKKLINWWVAWGLSKLQVMCTKVIRVIKLQPLLSIWIPWEGEFFLQARVSLLRLVWDFR